MRSGFVAILGPPNAGKSTFLNQVLGMKLAITSDKPQTTRHRLLGVHTTDDLQMAFLDTPGLHKASRALNQRMVQVALDALAEVDAVLFMVEASPKGLAQGREAARILSKSGAPRVLALNKVDQVKNKQELLPMLAQASGWAEWRAVVPISALKGDGADLVLEELAACLPEGPALFPEDTLTDLPARFLAAELIREKVFRLTGQEVPYATAVTVEEWVEPEQPGHQVAIAATIHLERDSQKGIIIGKGGAMLKRIGSEARLDIQELIGQKVHLDLFVRVEPKWSRGGRGLDKLGY